MPAVSGVRARRAVVVLAVLAALVVSGCASGVTQPATDVEAERATLHGSVRTPYDGELHYWFEYGPTTAYGSRTPRQTLIVNDRAYHPVSAVLSGLSSATGYHFRVCAQWAGFEPWYCAADRTFTTEPGEPVTELSITATPALSPAFDSDVSDYVTRCEGADTPLVDPPVQVRVAAPPGTEVAVDQSAPRSGRFTRDVSLAAGERFRFTVAEGASTRVYHVRCLPEDFPEWSFSRTGEPSLGFTLVAPFRRAGTPFAPYMAFFDSNGVPVWWQSPGPGPGSAFDAKLLADDTIAFTMPPDFQLFGVNPDRHAYRVRALNDVLGTPLETVGSVTDFHDLLRLANGNYLLLTYKPRDGVNLTSLGGPASATVVDAEVQEITPEGSLVWSWNSKDHVGLSEITQGLTSEQLWDLRYAYDLVHINAIEADGNGLLISLQYTNAIYRIDRSSGAVSWKLGGTTRPESLSVVGDDQEQLFVYPHDVRRLADGTVTVFDTGSPESTHPPRAMRFRIDTAARRATVVEALSDPRVVAVPDYNGSARKLASGGWLVNWGDPPFSFGLDNPEVVEYAADGAPLSTLAFGQGLYSYRAVPIERGRLSAETLREAMDDMHPRG